MRTASPCDGLVVTESITLAPGVHVAPRGITVAADDVVIDGQGALLLSPDGAGAGITLTGRANVTIRNVRLAGYRHGIHARACRYLVLSRNRVSGTAELPPNTVFLDIWRPADQAYGAGILLQDVLDSRVEDNDLQHQQNGLLTYGCRRIRVARNEVSYNSGFGIHLYGTCDSLFEGNRADYCCRFEPREGGLHHGHMGADAAGFVAVYGSSGNTFRQNTARMGGDGFFLAGLTPAGEKRGCDDNLFEENDASLSPNIAFEATFCRGNVFRRNHADRSNYGFWLGFSWDSVIEGNRMVANRQAGVAVENGHGCAVRGNTFQANGHGVLLWSRRASQFEEAFPDALTSHDWDIDGNRFTRNGIGVRIAANQDHGIRNLPETAGAPPGPRPHGHRILRNDIQDNRIGVELVGVDDTRIEANILNRNVEANLRQDDAHQTVARNNLGSAGGYL
ncbi:MAG TPA: right-handed parallel beta-helix repeat-containing protein [Chthonomonadales bacterium]|nr:right-handed parallel beta-helix repeat-containing protein [Chthonomonadales bacterium]